MIIPLDKYIYQN